MIFRSYLSQILKCEKKNFVYSKRLNCSLFLYGIRTRSQIPIKLVTKYKESYKLYNIHMFYAFKKFRAKIGIATRFAISNAATPFRAASALR